jgi:zinc protease
MIPTPGSRSIRSGFWLLLLALISSTGSLVAQTKELPVPAGDPINTKIYQLSNGLTVIMSVNRTEPRINTMIATRAGSKNDPATNTGLAHYLEHMLFKGTDRFGTSDWTTEKVYLDQIESLYEQYNKTTDPARRTAIYRSIDSVSGIAARYAIANEYDKLVASIGVSGSNAFTSTEQTVYLADIPQNQLEKWLAIEAERFRNPILRLFHTELEAVYEEKNRTLDDDGSKAYEALQAALFSNHAYGTQTTIGTVEHLKNPSLKEIRKYYETYYVPNNMAIILVGDLDPERTIRMVEKAFGGMKPKPVPPYEFKEEPVRSEPTVREVVGPETESLLMAYRFPGAGTRDAMLMELTDLILAYKGAGLIDLNLNMQQKVLSAGSGTSIQKDYSTHYMFGAPNQGQTLEEVRDLLLAQLELVKQGKFDEEQLQAAVRNLRVDEIRQFESNEGRASALLDYFVTGTSWVGRLDQLAKFTKKDITDFARKNYTNDYAVVFKRTGTDEKTLKVEKPSITPVPVDRTGQSPFAQQILSTPAEPIKPVFLDYQKDINRLTLGGKVPVYYLPNRENQLFSLYYVFDMGRRNDPKLPYAIDYLQYLGTDKQSAAEVAREFFKLGCTFSVSSGEDQVYVSLSGLQESFEPALALFETLLANVKPDPEPLENMIEGEMKRRADAKLDKGTILSGALASYAIYGPRNPFTDRLSEKQLRALSPKELTQKIRTLGSYRHKVLYYGPASSDQLLTALAKHHKLPPVLKDYPAATVYKRNDMTKNVVYFVPYDMVQAEVLWLSKSGRYDPKLAPMTSLFNEYYGGMSGVVFQEIRESKALAYAAQSGYDTPSRKDDPYYISAYIGTQADKLPEALPAMNEILQTMPTAEQSFAAARAGIKNRIETERINRASILFSVLAAEKMGLDHDIRRDIYTELDRLTIEDLRRFHTSTFTGRPYAYAVIGSPERVTADQLKQFGEVKVLTLEEVFGY